MSRRRRILVMVLILGGVAGTAVLVGSPPGCNQLPRINGRLEPSVTRSQKLIALAAQEATQIPEIDMRLTRQLNLADVQIQHGWKSDATATLGAVCQTLESRQADALNDHARLSGWISVSELSRGIKQTDLAIRACDSAAAAMRKIDDPARRCQYVMGVANETQYLKGRAAAALLLAQAGPWTRSIDHLERRRQATVAFAAALFNFDEYAAGQQMLRQDDDAVWRSDTLAQLGSQSPSSASPMAASPSVGSYGKDLTYKNIFQNQRHSQTARD